MPVKRLPRAGALDFLGDMRRDFRTAADGWSEQRREMLDDETFYAGKQWTQEALAMRTGRPCLTINRQPSFKKQVINEIRQNWPDIQIDPVGDGADPECAEIFQGVSRHIDQQSNGRDCWETALDQMVVMGMGWVQLITDYVDGDTFDTELKYRRIPNAFSVYPDPHAQELDFSDMRYCFVTADMSKEEFRRQFGEDAYASAVEFQGLGDDVLLWMPEGSLRVVTYYHIDYEKTHLVAVRRNEAYTVIPEDEMDQSDTVLVGHDGKPMTRTRAKPIVTVTKACAACTLEESVWPGPWIPVVPLLGDPIRIDGKRQFVGQTRWSRDPARMYSYWRSAQTEAIALTPKAPVVGAEGQFEGHEAEWDQANVRAIMRLEYVPKSFDGNLLPPPSASPYDARGVQAISLAIAGSDNDLKSVLSLFDASLGQRGPEQSGKAILARQKQGEIGNSDYAQNLARGMRHMARIQVAAIPKVYDTARVIRIMGADDSPKMIALNQPFLPGKNPSDPPEIVTPEEFIEGVHKFYDLGTGTYGVTVSIGPSSVTRRQEAVASMLELVKADPQLMAVIGDLLVSNMDWPGARPIAERLKKLLPPNLSDSQDMQIPPQVQQQIQQGRQLVGILQQELTKAHEVIHSKQLELASKEYQVGLQEQTKVIIAEAKLSAENAQTALKAEYERIATLLEMSHDRIMAENQVVAQAQSQGADQAHQAAMAAMPPAEPASGASASQ